MSLRPCLPINAARSRATTACIELSTDDNGGGWGRQVRQNLKLLMLGIVRKCGNKCRGQSGVNARKNGR